MDLFQIDPTYKLIWRTHNVQDHGTSNAINEFFPTGLVVASHEDGETFAEIFESLELTIKHLLADGSKAITQGKQKVWPKSESEEVDSSRLMCYPHVNRLKPDWQSINEDGAMWRQRLKEVE